MEFMKLKPKLILGLKYNVKNNIEFLDDNLILYPAGSVVVIYDLANNEQKFLKISNRNNTITQLAVSQNYELFAVCESGEQSCINIYRNLTFKRKTTFAIPADILNEHDPKTVQANIEIISIAFAYDNSLLIVIIGKPLWLMICHDLDTDRIKSCTKLNNVGVEATIVQVACNPSDHGLLVVVGKYIFRILANNDGTWRQLGYNKAFANLISFTCVSWLSQNRILAGTDDGRLFLLESGELRFIYDANLLLKINLKAKEEFQKVSKHDDDDKENEIRSILSFSKGFVFSCGFGTIHVFKKISNYSYEKRNVCKIPGVSQDSKDLINCMTINLTMRQLLVTCGRPQIYSIQLWRENLEECTENVFDLLGLKLHDCPISDLSCCRWKPIFATCGEKDQTVRIWNYETYNLDMLVKFQQTVISLALHPTGLFILIAFVEKLKFMSIHYDNLCVIREFFIANCRNCSFSYEGAYFAFSHKKTIFIYSVVELCKIYELKAHSGEVQSLSWTENGHVLVSCGADGIIYEWDMKTGERSAETIIKHNQLTRAINTLNGKEIFAITLDGFLKIILRNIVIKNYEISKKKLNHIALSNLNNLLIISESDGSIITLKLPIRKDELERKEYFFHASTIRKIIITYDNKYLISCSNDGDIVFWEIVHKEPNEFGSVEDFGQLTGVPTAAVTSGGFDEILVEKIDYFEKLKTIQDLIYRIDELKHEHEFHLRELQAAHEIELSNTQHSFQIIIDENNRKINELDELCKNETDQSKRTIESLRENHANEIKRMETYLHDKLIVEYDKYNDLLETKKSMRLMYLKEIEDLKNAAKFNEDSLKNDFSQKLANCHRQIETVELEKESLMKLHQFDLERIATNTNNDMEKLKENFRIKITDLHETNGHLRAEISQLNKRLAQTEQIEENLRSSLKSSEADVQKLKKNFKKYDNDMNDLRKEIAERDELIQTKEKRVRDLTISHEELEKIRIVHEYKIKELNDKIEPKDEQIQEQKDQIAEILSELVNLDRTITDLQLQLNQSNEKLLLSREELKKEELKCRQLKSTLKSLEMDLLNSKHFIQDPVRLKVCLKDIYSKYILDDQLVFDKIENTEFFNELKRYRNFLESSIDKLQKTVFVFGVLFCEKFTIEIQ